jgi:uncharacterized protein (TIGR00661 family)
MKESKHILFCVLNWGLGHATRSISVIREFQRQGFVVDIASDGGPLELLRKTFPGCTTHELKGYNIQYPSRSVFINAVSQAYKMFRAVRIERRQIEQLITANSYDAIISDNRYGCCHNSIPCVLITHQLSNITPSSWTSRPAEWIIQYYLKQFDEIWVPDTPDRMLTGKMTESDSPKVRFIGHISDMKYDPQEKVYDVTAILSGPEPQRTRLEQELLPQFAAYPGNCALVRGVIKDEPIRQEGNVTIHAYLDRSGIQEILNSSSIIISRTGYTSIMDLLNVGTKAILIPTPGQPEQMYLGERLKGHGQFVVQRQGSVDVTGGIAGFGKISAMQVYDNDRFALTSAIARLKSKVL